MLLDDSSNSGEQLFGVKYVYKLELSLKFE